MGAYKYMRELWKQPRENLGEVWRQRLQQWRTEGATVRIDRPTRLDRARSLGYKAKPGIFMVRQRVLRGGRMRAKVSGGRRPKHFRHKKILGMSYQLVAEQRTIQKYVNCEVLNSYFAGKDGQYYWYEVIMLDKSHPAVAKDPHFAWITTSSNNQRVFRGLTAAGKRSRGILTHKGKGAEKLRPSLRANLGRAK
ncbi:50S ribosomal protein L15e [Candidatus Woesearchaeota archaeon]|nr:50S ribosomal protein L15e [Candidatus Woesearchaeota archaeon]